MKIKIAILVDPCGHDFGDVTAEMEVEDHKRVYTELLAPAEIRFQHVWSVNVVDPGTDLFIYDFGGMMPGTNLMESNAHSAVAWAKDNPDSLLMVVSGFTYEHYIRYELDELGLDLHNVEVDDAKREDPIPEWFRRKFNLPQPDLDKVFDAHLEIRDCDLDDQGFKSSITEEQPQEIEVIKNLAEDDTLGNPDTEEQPERDWNLEAPKEPVAYITVPVYCDWYPGVAKGQMRFKLADSMVKITEGEGKDEVEVAHMGGAFAGVYEITFPDGKGQLWGYCIKPKDFWEQFEKMHNAIKNELTPENAKNLV